MRCELVSRGAAQAVLAEGDFNTVTRETSWRDGPLRNRFFELLVHIWRNGPLRTTGFELLVHIFASDELVPADRFPGPRPRRVSRCVRSSGWSCWRGRRASNRRSRPRGSRNRHPASSRRSIDPGTGGRVPRMRCWRLTRRRPTRATGGETASRSARPPPTRCGPSPRASTASPPSTRPPRSSPSACRSRAASACASSTGAADRRALARGGAGGILRVVLDGADLGAAPRAAALATSSGRPRRRGPRRGAASGVRRSAPRRRRGAPTTPREVVRRVPGLTEGQRASPAASCRRCGAERARGLGRRSGPPPAISRGRVTCATVCVDRASRSAPA